jgi:hypothetical protein
MCISEAPCGHQPPRSLSRQTAKMATAAKPTSGADQSTGFWRRLARSYFSSARVRPGSASYQASLSRTSRTTKPKSRRTPAAPEGPLPNSLGLIGLPVARR